MDDANCTYRPHIAKPAMCGAPGWSTPIDALDYLQNPENSAVWLDVDLGRGDWGAGRGVVSAVRHFELQVVARGIKDVVEHSSI
jgi:hypothetical protein